MNAPAPEHHVEPAQGFWRTVRESLSGAQFDFTRLPIRRSILLLAIPMALEMGMEATFALVDACFVSRLGASAIAVVGLTESMLAILYAVAFGLAMSITPMVSRRIGEGDPLGAARATTQAIGLGVLISLPVTFVGLFFAEDLLAAMGADAETIATGSNYTRIMLATNVVILLLFLHNAAFRGAGNAAIALRVLMLSNAINCALDPCLIFGLGPFPELGVTGAAVATSCGRGIGVLYQLWHLSNGRHLIVLRREALRFHPKSALDLLKLSAGGIGQMLIATCSWTALFKITAEFGKEAVAGYTVGVRILIFTLLPAWGVANAAATLVGQNLGAKDPARAERAVWITGYYNMLFLGAVTLVMIICAEPLVAMIVDDPAVREQAAICVRTLAYGYPLYAWGMVAVQALNGAGDTMTPTWINFGCFWVLELPLAWWLAMPLGQGPAGVFWAVAIAESLMAVVAFLAFRSGRWKTRVV